MSAASKPQNPTPKPVEDKPSVLVAGGAGFLGSYVCEALTIQGFNVLCVDNLKHGAKANIERLLQLPNFTFWQEDIAKTGFTVTPTINLNYIFHLASIEEFLDTKDVPLQTLTVNSVGTKNLLDLAVTKKAKFVFVSSSEVLYGAITQTNLTKYFSGGQKFNHFTFAEAKRFAEALVTEYVKDHDVSAVVIRIKDAYGPRMDLSVGSTMASFIRQAVKEKKIRILGDGLKTLNPTFVTDIVFGIVKAALKGEKGDVFNLIDSNKHTERSVAEALKKITGAPVEFKKADEVDTPILHFTSGKAEETLKWSPKVTLDQGLDQTIRFYKEQPKGVENPSTAPKQTTLQLQTEKRQTVDRSLILKLFLVPFLVVITWFVFLPSAFFGGYVYLGGKNISNAVDGLDNDSLTLSIDQSARAANYYKKGQESLGSKSWTNSLIGLKSISLESNNYLFMAENLSLSAGSTAAALESILIASQPTTEKELVLNKISLAKKNLIKAREKLEIANSLASNGAPTTFFLRGEFAKRQENASTLENIIKTLEVSLSQLE